LAALAAGEDAAAANHFELAIRETPADPRAYYLRALCLMRLGQEADAHASLSAGAQWEARQPDRFAIAEVLRIVPKSDRQLIESYRYRARIGESLEPVTLEDGVVGSKVTVLRDKVSIPLNQLVEPIALSEWLDPDNSSAEVVPTLGEPLPLGSADSEPGPSDNPFVDDPEPAISANTHADEAVVPAAFVDEQPAGKIPASKLMGIFGRVLSRTAPVPSLDGLRDQIPDWAAPTAGDDPLAAPPAEMNLSPAPPTESADVDEDDPFGGF
jgi:hypothetical protein